MCKTTWKRLWGKYIKDQIGAINEFSKNRTATIFRQTEKVLGKAANDSNLV